MRRLIKELKQSRLETHQQSSGPPSSPTAISISSPTPLDVLRYRSHHGANLGSIFVLEKWLFPSMFVARAAGDSELDAVTAYGF